MKRKRPATPIPPSGNAAAQTDKAAPTEFERNKLEAIAFQETIASHVVGILTHEGQNVGTGTLLRYGTKRLILTAYHVLEVTPISKVRFAFRPSGSLQTAPLREFGSTPTPLIAGRSIDPLRVRHDKANDLTAVVLRPQEALPGNATLYDATRVKPFRLIEQASLLFTGFPMDNAVQAGPRVEAVGMVSEHSFYDVALNKSAEVVAKIDPARQFAMKYTWAGALRPDRLSGSAIWCGRNSSSPIWTVNLALAGVVTDYDQSRQLIYATNLRRVLALIARS